jgi:beta-glucosidase
VGQLPVYYNAKRPTKHDYVETDSKPLYSFGYGLSYSKFEYSDLQVSPVETPGAVRVTVRFKVKNTSARAGDEVAQLYLSDDVSSVVTSVKQLKKFQRLTLKANEQQEVTLEMTAEDLMLLNGSLKWTVEPGTFTVQVGASSEDIRAQAQFKVGQAVENIAW